MRHIQLLQTHHSTDRVRQLPKKLIVTHIKHCQIFQKPNLRRQTRSKAIIHENNLIQSRHIPNAPRHTPMKFVISKNNNRNRRVPEIFRQVKPESIVVDENGVQILVKKLLRNRPFELVEPQIQKLQLRQLKNHPRELPGEAIITQIQLEQQLQVFELVRNSPTEPIGVYMKQCKIHKQTKLLRQVPGNVAVVKVNSGDCTDRRIIRRRSAENPFVVTNIRSNPILSKI